MIKDSAKRLFDVLIVWKLDRFARKRYDSAHYKSILKKNGVRVVSASEAIATDFLRPRLIAPETHQSVQESIFDGMYSDIDILVRKYFECLNRHKQRLS